MQITTLVQSEVCTGHFQHFLVVGTSGVLASSFSSCLDQLTVSMHYILLLCTHLKPVYELGFVTTTFVSALAWYQAFMHFDVLTAHVSSQRYDPYHPYSLQSGPGDEHIGAARSYPNCSTTPSENIP